jgi:transcriptional regulator with XRE-family HTH domain
MGISKNELARRVGAAGPTVIEWFTRGALPDGEKLARLPEALGVNGHWLLTGEGSMLPPGAGPDASDRATRTGAQSVIADVRHLVHDLEAKYAEPATLRAAKVAGFVREQAQKAQRTPGRRKTHRKLG